MHAIILFSVAGFVLLIIREICLIVYRLYFHPLARIPGPKLASATQWYEFYYDVLKWPGGQYWREVDKMHERYGKVPPSLNASIRCHYQKKHCTQSSRLAVPTCLRRPRLKHLSSFRETILTDTDREWHSKRPHCSCHASRSSYQGP